MADQARQGLLSWAWGGVRAAANAASGAVSRAFGWSGTSSAKSAPPGRGRDPRPYLAGAAPGGWSSNHLSEAGQCKGWQFVAVRALAKMASGADLSVHETGGKREQEKRVRKALRLARMCGDRREARRWKSKLKRMRSGEAKREAEEAARLERLRDEYASVSRHKSESVATSTRHARTPVPDHHPLRQLLLRPNPEWSGVTLLFAAAQQLALTGSCLLWCVRNELGVPAELYVLPTGLAIPQPPSSEYPKGWYRLTPLAAWGLQPENGGWSQGALGSALLSGATIDAQDVKAVRWPHPLYLSDGLSPLSACALWVDVANEMDRANWSLLQNSASPGMVFAEDPALAEIDPADKARFEEWLKADSAGPGNRGKHLWLPKGINSEGAKGRTAEELDFSTGRTAYRDASLAMHEMSPVAAGISEAGSYSAFWAAIKQSTELSVQPMLTLVAGELTELLGDEWEGPRCEIGYAARAIDDPQVLESRLATDISAKDVLRVDEYRALRGLPPLGGERGKAFVGADPNQRLDGAVRAAAITVNEYRAEIGLPPLPEEMGGQIAGARTTVKAKDEDPERPGVQGGPGPGVGQGGASPAGNGPAAPGVAESLAQALGGGHGVPGAAGKSLKSAEWEESKHPRADDGKFGSGAGAAKDGKESWQTTRTDYVRGELNAALDQREQVSGERSFADTEHVAERQVLALARDANEATLERIRQGKAEKAEPLLDRNDTVGVYECRHCGGDAYGGIPGEGIMFRGSARCSECGKTTGGAAGGKKKDKAGPLRYSPEYVAAHPEAFKSGSFDESKHPRADDGKFGGGEGSGGGEDKTEGEALPSAAPPSAAPSSAQRREASVLAVAVLREMLEAGEIGEDEYVSACAELDGQAHEAEADEEHAKAADGAAAKSLKAAPKRQQGEVWQGQSGRWFTVNAAGRTVPAKKPGGGEAGGDAAGGMEKPQAAPKKPRKGPAPTPEEAKRAVEDAVAGGDLSAVSDAFSRMRLADMRALVAEMGLGVKDRAVAGLAAKAALAALGKVRGEATASPVAAPADPVGDAMSRIEEMRAAGRAGAQDMHDLAGTLLGMTVPQLTELKKRLGLRAGGAKYELASKLAAGALKRADEKRAASKADETRAKPKPKKEDDDGGTGEGRREGGAAGDGRAGGADAGAGGPVAGEAGQAGREEADRGRDAAGESAGRGTAERVPADDREVKRRLDRYEKLFRDRGQHHVSEWLGKLRGHIEAVGGQAALAALGGTGTGKGDGKEVQYWGVGTEEANWKNMGSFIEAYLGRSGITAVTGDTSSPGSPLISALGAPDRFVAENGDFKPSSMHFKNKLDEAKTLPGLEASEDLGTLMGGDKPPTHLTNEVTAKLDEKYGPGQWIVKCYDDNAAAGYGIFFPQRAAAVVLDARNTIWDAGGALAKYGFGLKRDDGGKVVGLKHENGDEYLFGTEKYQETIGGDARQWGDRAANAAHHENGAMLPEGSFMAQPAFKAVGISDEERAAGKTWHEKNEGRVHLVTREDGSVEVVPHSTWLKGGNLPVVFEDEDTKAMAEAAKKAIEAIPHEARRGQVYAPDVMKTADGYSVVELNAQGDSNGSGYLHDNGFTIDAYTSYLAGREPLHVQFIRRLLTTRKKGDGA